MTLTELLAPIKSRLEKATPGPWSIEPEIGHDVFADKTRVASSDPRWNFSPGKTSCYSNLNLIANAPTDIKKLIEALECADSHLRWVASDSRKYAGSDVWSSAQSTQKEIARILGEIK